MRNPYQKKKNCGFCPLLVGAGLIHFFIFIYLQFYFTFFRSLPAPDFSPREGTWPPCPPPGYVPNILYYSYLSHLPVPLSALRALHQSPPVIETGRCRPRQSYSDVTRISTNRQPFQNSPFSPTLDAKGTHLYSKQDRKNGIFVLCAFDNIFKEKWRRSSKHKDTDVMPKSAGDRRADVAMPLPRCRLPTSADVEQFYTPRCRRWVGVWLTSVCRCRDADSGTTSADFVSQ